MEKPTPLHNFPISLRLPVLWGDQDLFGHVNNVVHLRWFESSRVLYWDDTGIRALMGPRRWGPILAAIHCDYRRQLRYPDAVWVGASIQRIGKTSLTMEHVVYSETLQAVAAEGQSVIVLFNYEEQRAEAISTDVRALVAKVEGHPIP